jgi:Tfp pilus assembly PilM family ATPase
MGPEEPRPAVPSAPPGALSELRRRGTLWLRRQLQEPERPLVAVEVRLRSVGVVRLAREGRRLALAAAAAVDLPPGCLDLSITQPNVADADGFRRALRAVLERCGVLAGARVALVLPDPVARVALLPAADVAGHGRAHAEELIRFRLRKSVPFEIREAHLAFTADGARGSDAVVAAIHRPVLEGYEEACRSAGLEPGLVELSGLALMGSAFAGRATDDRALVNWDEGYVTILLLRGGWPLLVRTLTGEQAADPQQVAREVGNTVLYYRDRLGGSGLAEASLRSAALPPERAAAVLEEPLGIAPGPVEPWRAFSPDVPPAMAQVLAGAAASLAGGRG